MFLVIVKTSSGISPARLSSGIIDSWKVILIGMRFKFKRFGFICFEKILRGEWMIHLSGYHLPLERPAYSYQ
jgi:hypothetical protein